MAEGGEMPTAPAEASQAQSEAPPIVESGGEQSQGAESSSSFFGIENPDQVVDQELDKMQESATDQNKNEGLMESFINEEDQTSRDLVEEGASDTDSKTPVGEQNQLEQARGQYAGLIPLKAESLKEQPGNILNENPDKGEVAQSAVDNNRSNSETSNKQREPDIVEGQFREEPVQFTDTQKAEAQNEIRELSDRERLLAEERFGHLPPDEKQAAIDKEMREYKRILGKRETPPEPNAADNENPQNEDIPIDATGNKEEKQNTENAENDKKWTPEMEQLWQIHDALNKLNATPEQMEAAKNFLAANPDQISFVNESLKDFLDQREGKGQGIDEVRQKQLKITGEVQPLLEKEENGEELTEEEEEKKNALLKILAALGMIIAFLVGMPDKLAEA